MSTLNKTTNSEKTPPEILWPLLPTKIKIEFDFRRSDNKDLLYVRISDRKGFYIHTLQLQDGMTKDELDLLIADTVRKRLVDSLLK